MVFAWPGAEIGIMASTQAVGIVERRRIAGSADAELPAQLAREYAARHLTAEAAAASGFVDEVIEPQETRAALAWALESHGGRA
jgi:acetyl-CoA carboxylase carboxyltransferase component